MVATAQINGIADELLAQARASKFGYTDPSGVPVPSMYQCADLARLPNGLQSDIVSAASRAVGTSPAFLLSVLGLVIAIILIFGAARQLAGTALPYSLMLCIAPLAPLLQVMLVRHAVRRIAARVAASWPAAARV
ncbi:hypothetical protein LK542_13480 [Massilia sp. IC2-477]|uniref:hypothetical protein n=1 Tax=Massilia sp. IC2-477 TaxID=2887198 RepID=UPI001D117466|nr:hypothetical protein [Massilia sp. IC2-477]MCC2956625.1 hypothetical protein [Massilia sp. IC2-477]